MTTLEITLPDSLATEAKAAGLLESSMLERLVREALRENRLQHLAVLRERLATDPLPPMTQEEIQAEIEAYRAQPRRAPGT